MRQEIMELDQATEMPVYVGEGTSSIKVDKWKAIWNMGKNQAAAVVSQQYELIQHRDVATAFLDACDRLNLKTKTSFAQAGNKAFMDIEFPESRIGIGLNEEFILGFRIVNSYDKSTGVIITPRLVRLACMNGMVVTSKNFVQAYNYRHNQDMAKNFEKYIEVALNEMINSNEKLKAIVNSCMADSVEWETTEFLMKNLFDVEKHRVAIMEKLDGITNITRWDIYNAITNYATHGEQLTPNVESALQAKANKVLNKPCVELVERLVYNKGIRKGL